VAKLEKVFEVKNHGLLLSCIALAIEIMETKPEKKEIFENYIPV